MLGILCTLEATLRLPLVSKYDVLFQVAPVTRKTVAPNTIVELQGCIIYTPGAELFTRLLPLPHAHGRP